jgi:hypothetical protein
MGAYANVLAVLGLQDDLALLGRDDVLGRKLQDSELATRARANLDLLRSRAPTVTKCEFRLDCGNIYTDTVVGVNDIVWTLDTNN